MTSLIELYWTHWSLDLIHKNALDIIHYLLNQKVEEGKKTVWNFLFMKPDTTEKFKFTPYNETLHFFMKKNTYVC